VHEIVSKLSPQGYKNRKFRIPKENWGDLFQGPAFYNSCPVRDHTRFFSESSKFVYKIVKYNLQEFIIVRYTRNFPDIFTKKCNNYTFKFQHTIYIPAV
jgi:hypothetical protein